MQFITLYNEYIDGPKKTAQNYPSWAYGSSTTIVGGNK